LTKIILIRHGETDWNRIHRLQGGDSDTPLNALGMQQAENVALRLKSEKLEAVYSSPLQRALRTAQAIAAYHQLEVTALPALKEIHVGELEGAATETLKVRWDQLVCQGGDPNDPRMTGIEPIRKVQERAWGVIQDIGRRHPEGNVAVVSHNIAIMSIVCAVLGLPLMQIPRLHLSNGSITAFTMNETDARLELFNEACHQTAMGKS
jgi:broad specificity phosphatase PhoE